jgi:hypothetical protein
MNDTDRQILEGEFAALRAMVDARRAGGRKYEQWKIGARIRRAKSLRLRILAARAARSSYLV